MDKKNLLQAGPIKRKTATDVRRRVFQSAVTTIFVFSAPASAWASAFGGGIGAGRLLPAAAAVAGLIGIIIGRRALIRSHRNGNRQAGAIAAGVLGLISVATGVLHAANSAGGFGTGNGLAGAMVAIVLGLISMALGGLAFFRSRREIISGASSVTRNRKQST